MTKYSTMNAYIKEFTLHFEFKAPISPVFGWHICHWMRNIDNIMEEDDGNLETSQLKKNVMEWRKLVALAFEDISGVPMKPGSPVTGAGTTTQPWV